MVKLGILGAGIITECHFFALERIPEAKIAAIASIDQSGKTAAEKYGAHYYKDYKELLEKEKDLDGIVVALPNHMHYQGCVDAPLHSCGRLTKIGRIGAKGKGSVSNSLYEAVQSRFPKD